MTALGICESTSFAIMPSNVSHLQSPADWLREQARGHGMTVTDVARRSDVDQGALSRAMKRGGPSREVLRTIANALKWTIPDAVLLAAPPGRSTGPQRVAKRGAIPALSRIPTAQPVDQLAVWTTYPREEPWFYYNDQEIVETVARPSALQSAQHIMAIRMPNASMSPWRQPDEFIVLALRRPVAPGNHALVRLVPRARPNETELSLIARIDRMPEGDKPPAMTIYNLRGGVPDMKFFAYVSMIRVLEWSEVSGLS